MRGRRQQAERRVLVVDDEVAIRIAIETLLRKRGYRYSSAQNGSEAIQLLSSNVYDLVVTDLHMERRDTGLKVVRAARRKNPDTPVLVITGYGDVENAVAAMKAGAYDFMEKPFSIDDLEATIEAAISHKRGSQGPEPGSGSSDPFEGIIGRDPAIQQTFNTIRTIADTDATVLLTGESGVGKELFARAIHRSNPRRRRGYFVPVNCAAIPEGLIESELFGSVKGSFTNSTEDRPGMFRMADKGTILLDEIGDMPAMTQVKLLRVLNERQVRPVGASQAIPIDVRVIAATHRNLEQLVRDGKFREDLYYRLNVIPIAIPPLRARSEDIILIAMHFIERFNREDGRNIEGLSSDAQDVLLRYTWPGNIRELENTIRRTVIMCGDGVISADDLPDKLNFEISDEMLNAAPGLSTSMFEPSSHTLFVPFSQDDLPARSDNAYPAASEPSSSERLARSTDRLERPTMPPLHAPPTLDSSGGYALQKGPITLTLETLDIVLPDEGVDLRALVEAIENTLIDQALARVEGNRAGAARLLKMNRTTLVERLKKRDKLRERRAKKAQASKED